MPKTSTHYPNDNWIYQITRDDTENESYVEISAADRHTPYGMLKIRQDGMDPDEYSSDEDLIMLMNALVAAYTS